MELRNLTGLQMKSQTEAYTELGMTGTRDELPKLPSRFQPGDLAVFRTHDSDAGTVVEIRGVQFLPTIIFYDILIGQNHVPGGKNVGMGLVREFDHRINHVPSPMLFGMHTKDYSTATLRRLRDGKESLQIAQGTPLFKLDDMFTEDLKAMYLQLFEGATALQSLDDLGDPEDNQQAMDDIKTIQERMSEIKKLLSRRGEVCYVSRVSPRDDPGFP